jgi:hypothetical protein
MYDWLILYTIDKKTIAINTPTIIPEYWRANMLYDERLSLLNKYIAKTRPIKDNPFFNVNNEELDSRILVTVDINSWK